MTDLSIGKSINGNTPNLINEKASSSVKKQKSDLFSPVLTMPLLERLGRVRQPQLRNWSFIQKSSTKTSSLKALSKSVILPFQQPLKLTTSQSNQQKTSTSIKQMNQKKAKQSVSPLKSTLTQPFYLSTEIPVIESLSKPKTKCIHMK